MKKSKNKNYGKKIGIGVGVIIFCIGWVSFVRFVLPFFEYSFTNHMPPDTQKQFREEYLTPLCEKLIQAPVNFDKDLSENEKAYWMTVRYSILPRFKSCSEFAAFPSLRHGMSEFADHSIYIATYDFGSKKTYEIHVWNKGLENRMELDGLKGLDNTPLCYGKNLNLETVIKQYMPERTNRKLYYENLNSQCN